MVKWNGWGENLDQILPLEKMCWNVGPNNTRNAAWGQAGDEGSKPAAFRGITNLDKQRQTLHVWALKQ